MGTHKHTPSAHIPSAQPALARDWLICSGIILLSAGLALAIQLPSYLHQDVAFLSWTADKVMRGAVFGRDIYEVNPPLSFLIYVPAALLGRVIGLDLAIKLWTVAVAALSMSCLWQTADRSIRLPVVAALGLFFALAFPREFGQREQFTLLLCAPYVAGPAQHRGLAVLSGVMAGLGFALKPFFLIPLLLVFLTRRRIRAEEWAIAATGICYAASLPLFFLPYLCEFLPKVATAYWSVSINSMSVILEQAVPGPACALILLLLSRGQRGTAGFAMAAVGFTIALVLYGKGFPYHFVPTFGFLVIYLACLLENPRRTVRVGAMVSAVLAALQLTFFAVPWFYDIEKRRTTTPALLAEVNKASSYSVLSNYTYPAFPTAILTTTPYLGLSSNNAFMSAVGSIVTGATPSLPLDRLGELAVEQAVSELSRRPELVIVETRWQELAALTKPFNGLAWLDSNPAFHAQWAHYVLVGRIDDFMLYRRRQTQSPF